MNYDCLVIGAGISGLSSSIILSRNGLKTALVEKSLKTGPLVRGFRRKGHYFDTGFHHAGGIGEGSSGRVMLNYLGIGRHLNIIPFSPDCFDIIKFTDSSFEFRFPTGYENIQDRLSEVFPDDLHAIDGYIREIKRQCSLLPFLNLDADLKGMNILENVHGSNLDEFLTRLTKNPYLKSVLGIHCMLNGVPSSEQGLNNYAYIVGPYYESASYIEGGGSALISAFEKTAKENGVDIFTGKDAAELLFSSSGDLTGIRFKDGSDIGCRNIISTVHPMNMLKIVPESMFRSSYVSRIRGLDETPSAFILFGISEVDLKGVFGFSLHLIPAMGPDFGDFKRPVEERPVNIIVSMPEGEKSSQGKTFVVICPAIIKEMGLWKDSTRRNRPPEYNAFKEQIRERMLSHVEASFPALAGKIHAIDCSTPLTLRDYSGSPFGSMYGAKHRVEQYNPFPMTKIPGLYLAGQSIVAPGLLGTMISAFLACGNILGHDFIRGELKRWD